jgi:hypothetical protein
MAFRMLGLIRTGLLAASHDKLKLYDYRAGCLVVIHANFRIAGLLDDSFW